MGGAAIRFRPSPVPEGIPASGMGPALDHQSLSPIVIVLSFSVIKEIMRAISFFYLCLRTFCILFQDGIQIFINLL